MGCEHIDLICVGGVVETELITQLSYLLGELVERGERVLDLGIRQAGVGKIVYKLLILLFKLCKSLLGGLGVVGVAFIQPVQLVDGLLHGVLQAEQHIVDFLVYKREVGLGIFNIYYLI